MTTPALMALLLSLDPHGVAEERHGEVVLDLRIDRATLDDALANDPLWQT